ncbi:MAG: hypothetical protein M5U13_15765 [Thermoanaerobaculia bacterium]|nr:hypothetical protein [Thermoanaerobaculia bacterium]
MAKPEVIGTVHGDHHDYEIKKRDHTFSDPDYYVRREDGEVSGTFDSRAAAYEWAQEKAGRNR